MHAMAFYTAVAKLIHSYNRSKPDYLHLFSSEAASEVSGRLPTLAVFRHDLIDTFGYTSTCGNRIESVLATVVAFAAR